MTELIIRPATAADAATLFALIQALADYEQLSHQVTGTAELLAADLSGHPPQIEALLAVSGKEVVGFALFFANYSTFLTRSGLYLEDLFVLPAYRRRGIGKQLLLSLVALAVQRGAGRLEWAVLDWNAQAIAFYESIGAAVLPDWRICRLTQGQLVATTQSMNCD